MEPQIYFTLVFLLFLNLYVLVLTTDHNNYSRSDFPVDFIFGSGTSAYQVEGAAYEDGRTPSIWDTFAHAGFAYGGNGDVACDAYHKYKEQQQGFVGISFYTFGIVPQTNTEKDRAACERIRTFYFGWFMEPLLHGDYPSLMKENAGARIPAFTTRESEQVKGSYDFIGIIHYTKFNVSDNSDGLNTKLRDFSADTGAILGIKDLLGDEEYPMAPWALQEVLETFKTLYGNPPIFIHENGQRTVSNASLHDVSRVEYLHAYIGSVLDSLRNGSNVKGYFVWSFMDAFELLDGYKSIYGLYSVDRNDPELRRYPKLSAKWYKQFLNGSRTSLVGDIKLKEDSSLASLGHSFQ
ncbi:hypothetical protein RYX36_020296 [Vicia faba]